MDCCANQIAGWPDTSSAGWNVDHMMYSLLYVHLAR